MANNMESRAVPGRTRSHLKRGVFICVALAQRGHGLKFQRAPKRSKPSPAFTSIDTSRRVVSLPPPTDEVQTATSLAWAGVPSSTSEIHWRTGPEPQIWSEGGDLRRLYPPPSMPSRMMMSAQKHVSPHGLFSRTRTRKGFSARSTIDANPEEKKNIVRVLKPFLLLVMVGALAGSNGLGEHVGAITNQVSYEIAHCTDSPAKYFGFIGACCNWFLGLSAVVDAKSSGPEVISIPMTLALLAYSALFARWAGWDISPQNFILAGSHIFNFVAQLFQLRRAVTYKLETQGAAGRKKLIKGARTVAGLLTAAAAYTFAAPTLRAAMPPGSWLASPAGIFTIHPFPPLTKLFLSAASLRDLFRPTDQISLLQYTALTVTGLIFIKYGSLITPINIPLIAVNILLFGSSAWHLGRKIKADFVDPAFSR